MSYRRFFSVPALILAVSSQSVFGQTNVLTQHNDIGRTGQDLTETVLTTANVNTSQFGKLYAIQLDAQAYAQPLYISSLSIGGANHSVLFVATENDSVYAFDTAANGAQLWKASLLDGAHGAAAGAIADPNSTTGCGNIEGGIVGVTGTPVIDPSTGTLYVVSRTNESGTIVYRLHALDVTTGNEKFGGPTKISAAVAGTGAGSANGVVAFNPVLEKQAPGLLLEAGSIFIGFGSFCDTSPWHGWFMQYNATTLAQTSAFLTTPNGTGSGVWMSGAGPAADDENGTPRVFVATGNGTYDASAPYGTNNVDYGDDILSFNVTNGLKVADSFTPQNQATLQAQDADVGSGGVMVLPDNLPGSPVAHLAVQIDKVGTMFLLNRDNLGGYNSVDDVVQEITTTSYGAGLWGAPAYWNGNVYFWPYGSNAVQYSITNGLLSNSPVATGADPGAPPTNLFLGSTPSVSANGTTNGIVWFDNWGNSSGGPYQVLYAYNASNISTLLWTSEQNPVRDRAGATQKFAVPTIADGKVYLASRNQVMVYGPLANEVVTGVPVSLSNVANVYAIVANGNVPPNGGLDAHGYSYSSSYLGSSLVWNSTNFSLGSAGTLNGVTSATIPLPTGNYNAVTLLATAVDGVQNGQVFTVTYSDGSTSSVTQSLSDWGGPSGYPSESMATSTALRVQPDGTTGAGPWYLYGYIIPLNPAKQVVSVTTPNNRNVVVLAVSLTPLTSAPVTAAPSFGTPAGTYTSTQTVSLSSTTSGASIYYTTNGTMPTTASTPYTSPITVSLTTTINAIAVSSSGGTSPIASATYTIQAAPTFTLSATSNPWTLQQNAGGSNPITVTPLNGFNAPVTLSVSGLPAGVGSAFSGNLLIVFPPLSTPTGTYPLTLTGTSGSTTVSTQLSLVITAGANFSLSPTSNTVNLAPGASATDAIAVSAVNGFSSAVSFSAAGFPSGASGSFSPANSASGTTLSITAGSGVAPGTYPITVTAYAPGTGNSNGFSQTTIISLVIAAAKTPSFTLSASANPLTLQQNAGGTDSISITPVNGFNSAVSLSVTGAPAGVGTAFSGNLLIVFPPPNTPTGTYPLTITGTGGGVTATTKVSLVITAGGSFTLSPAATSVTVKRGSSGTDAISVVPANGFSAAVSFAASNLPAGVTATFSPATSASKSVVTFVVGTTAKTGSYTITLSATAPGSNNSNSTTQTTTVTLVIS